MIPEPVMLDTYEDICSMGREYSEELDNRRWLLGDLANTVKSRYGEKTIDDFSRDIGQRKSTIYQYAKVSDFYPPVLRRRLLEDMPVLNYSHLRDGLRLKNITEAVAWLNEVASAGYTADEASRKLTERLGREVRDSAEGVLEGTTYYDGKYRVEISVSEDDLKWITKHEHLMIRAK